MVLSAPQVQQRAAGVSDHVPERLHAGGLELPKQSFWSLRLPGPETNADELALQRLKVHPCGRPEQVDGRGMLPRFHRLRASHGRGTCQHGDSDPSPLDPLPLNTSCYFFGASKPSIDLE